MKTRIHPLGRLSGAAVVAGAFLLVAAVLLETTPADAASQAFVTDSGGTYDCGKPAMGMSGVLKVERDPVICTTSGSLNVPALPDTATIATFHMAAVLDALKDVRIRGTELFVDITATTPGPLVFELGISRDLREFAPLGAVTVDVNSKILGELRVDLSTIWGVVPRGTYLALRVRKSASTFAGSLSLHNPSGFPPLPSSMRGSFFQGAWTVGKLGADFPNIQAAIDSANVVSGDRIYVMPGTYSSAGFVNVNFGTKNVMVIGEGGPDRTIIDCRYANRAFHFNTTSITNAGGIEGLTIRRANASSVLIESGAAPTIRNCVFRDSDSAAESGGAIHLNTKVAMTRMVQVEECRFIGNRTSAVTPTVNSGGAIAVEGGGGLVARFAVRGSTFLKNTAAGKGGAIFVSADTADVQLLDSTFLENSAVVGGALHADCDGAVTVQRSRFELNYAEAAGAAASRRVAFFNSVFYQNGASGNGGAVLVTGGTSTAHTVLDFCTLNGNFARRVGGVYMGSGNLTVANSILWGDWHTDASFYGGAELYTGDTGTLWLGNVDLRGGKAGIFGRVNPEPIDGGTIMDVNPLFAFAGSPHLMPGSPCIDKGVASVSFPSGMGLTNPSTDADGVPRSLTGGTAGTPDLGAYEYHGDAGRPMPILSAERLLLAQRQGGPPPDAIALTIKNASTSALPWTAAATVEADVPWLVVRPRGKGM